MTTFERFKSASKAAAIHLTASVFVAFAVGALVFLVWYPYPYRELAGGRDLFILVMGVDIVCGPLLTMVLYNPLKRRSELVRDLGLVVLIQLFALGYGVLSVWQARPLYLVMEIDRFKVIAGPDLASREANDALEQLPQSLKPSLFSGPLVVGIREPKNEDERKTVMVESIEGGRDYAQRPNFYVAYDDVAAKKSLFRAKPVGVFLSKYPNERSAVASLAAQNKTEFSSWTFLPVVGRQDWVAMLDSAGKIQGFVRGDGF